MKLAIVGCGAAGILTWLELLQQGISPDDITLIDPFFDGGALGRYWGAIFSNTTFSQIQTCLERYAQAQAKLQELSTKYQADSRVLLSDLGALLCSCIQTAFLESHTIQDDCIHIQYTDSGFLVHTRMKDIHVDAVFICQGGQQKNMDVGKPCIPLEVALDPARLRRYVQPSQKVCVFGLAHSGTLILKSLLDLDCRVFGIYKGVQPFLFARDGHYDGIKQESADIADELLKTVPQTCELISTTEIARVFKAIQRSHWVISAIGFEGSPIQLLDVSGNTLPHSVYSPETAEISHGLYGFGLAYPGITTNQGRTFKDVSIPSFQAQIQRCLPSCLAKIRNRSLPLDGAKQDNQ